MSIIFHDIQRETYKRVDNIDQLQSEILTLHGRRSRVWVLFMNDGEIEYYKQRYYDIVRIER